jgi:hypothetical protein
MLAFPTFDHEAVVLHGLASPDRLAEDVRVLAVVVAELKLGDVQRQVLGADLVERADDAALEDRPEALDRLGMDRSDDVLAGGMVDDSVRKLPVEAAIANPLIGAKQAYLFRYRAPYEALQRSGVNAIDNAGDDLPFALDSTDDRGLAGAGSTGSAALPALVDMLVLGEPTDERFIDFDNPHEFAEVFVRHSGPNAVAHVPRRPVRAEAHHAVYLKGANSLLAGQHEVDDAEPLAQRLIGVFEDRVDQDREPVTVISRSACVADPVEALGVRLNLRVAAARADDELGPAMLGEVELAGVVGREGSFPLADRHLRDGLGRLFRAGHLGSPVRSEASLPRRAGKVKHNRPNKV